MEHAQWMTALHEVEALRAQFNRSEVAADVQSRQPSQQRLAHRLIQYLHNDQVLVRYAAKNALDTIFFEFSPGAAQDEWIQMIVNEMSDANRLVLSGGVHFQLLKGLMHPRETEAIYAPSNGSEDQDGNSSGAQSESMSPDDSSKQPVYLTTLFPHLVSFSKAVKNVLALTPSESVDATCYCSLKFMEELVKCSCKAEIDLFKRSQLFRLLLDVTNSLATIDYSKRNIYVTNAMLEFVAQSCSLSDTSLSSTSSSDESMNTNDSMDDQDAALQTQWIECAIQLLLQPSCSSLAIQSLHESSASDDFSAVAFISSSSKYPFVQQWMKTFSLLFVNLIEGFNSDLSVLHSSSLSITKQQVPNRNQVLAALSEQDDVMVDVLDAMLRIYMKAKKQQQMLTLFNESIVGQTLLVEFQPDLLFASMVQSLGNDHLVILDWLISSETTMLQYLMHYLRFFQSNWTESCQLLQQAQLLDSIMTVFVRLRLEIERLVDANIFPYAPHALLRRLQQVEERYESLGQ